MVKKMTKLFGALVLALTVNQCGSDDDKTEDAADKTASCEYSVTAGSTKLVVCFDYSSITQSTVDGIKSACTSSSTTNTATPGDKCDQTGKIGTCAIPADDTTGAPAFNAIYKEGYTNDSGSSSCTGLKGTWTAG